MWQRVFLKVQEEALSSEIWLNLKWEEVINPKVWSLSWCEIKPSDEDGFWLQNLKRCLNIPQPNQKAVVETASRKCAPYWMRSELLTGRL